MPISDSTKKAADLHRGDAVIVAVGDRRVVEAVQFHGHPVDSRGTTGVRVKWFGRSAWSILAADREVTMETIHQDDSDTRPNAAGVQQ